LKTDLVVYEGAMCCSTGVCGPEPDMTLIKFNETLKKLQIDYKDLKIKRASLSFNFEAFLENKDIFQAVKENGPGILPITTLDGKIIAKQRYLPYSELRKEIEST
jgi:glutaredoxin-related protein